VHLEATTKPHVYQKFEIFWTNIASTMACPNFKNGPKNGLRCLGVNVLEEQLYFDMEATDQSGIVGATVILMIKKLK
jgi:hypothetical protein